MKFRFYYLIALGNLVLGIGLLFGVCVEKWTPFLSWQNEIYLFISQKLGKFENIQSSEFPEFIKIEKDDNKLSFLPFYSANKLKQKFNIACVEIQNDSSGIYSNPPNSLDYAVMLSQMRRNFEVNHLAILDPLYFSKNEELLSLETLSGEIKEFSNPVILGVTLAHQLTTEKIPEEMRKFKLSQENFISPPENLLSVGKIKELPSLVSKNNLNLVPSLFDSIDFFSQVDDEYQIPLVYQWNGEYFLSFPLACFIQSLNISKSDVKIDSGNKIWLGDNRYIEIDKSCRFRYSQKNDFKLNYVLAQDLIPPLGEGHDEKVLSKLKESDIVLLGKKNPLANSFPDNLTFQSILLKSIVENSKKSSEKITLNQIDTSGLWILKINIILLGIISLIFDRVKRWLILIGTWIVFATAIFVLVALQMQWVPLATNLSILILISLLGVFYPYPPVKKILEPKEDDDWSSQEEIPRPY